MELKKNFNFYEQKVEVWQNIAFIWMLFYWMEVRCDRSNQPESTQLTKLIPMKAIGKIVCFQGKKQSLSPQNFQRGTIVSTAREYWAGYRLYGED